MDIFSHRKRKQENVIHSVRNKTGEGRTRREGCREELTGLRQTQRMAAAVDPCCPPTLQQQHTLQLVVRQRESLVGFEDYLCKCRDVNGTFGMSGPVGRDCSVR